MHPAREVGGDFYDFFFVDDEHLCFVIGDVSDKGVPAALFMMVARAHLRTTASLDSDPGEMLYRTNNLLHADNESCMFVTILCARLNVRTGELRVANAGHNPPILSRKGAVPEYQHITAGFVAGGMQDTRYPVSDIKLAPGDLFFMYTDGVTEARSPSAGLFGEKRLLRSFSSVAKTDPHGIIESILAEVEFFAAGTAQSDDITLLALRYRGPVS
jgi:sigma-B regulation protein RsbU (phosphoserine phosphatase)